MPGAGVAGAEDVEGGGADARVLHDALAAQAAVLTDGDFLDAFSLSVAAAAAARDEPSLSGDGVGRTPAGSGGVVDGRVSTVSEYVQFLTPSPVSLTPLGLFL